MNPCLNNGTCIYKLDDYYCLCSEQFKGNNCEIRINFTCQTNNPCQNQAECIEQNNDHGYKYVKKVNLNSSNDSNFQFFCFFVLFFAFRCLCKPGNKMI
jgi:hypothetical protein